MIHHLRGRLIEKNPTYLVVECSGVGYLVNISLNTFSRITNDENLLLYTRLIVREDAHILYGFTDTAERDMFDLLLGVNGVGANTARTILSSATTDELVRAISSEDALYIQKIKGIGAKTAQRIILDLKDKVLKEGLTNVNTQTLNNTSRAEALSALEVLGYPRKQTEKLIDKILSESPGGKIEEILKLALKNL